MSNKVIDVRNLTVTLGKKKVVKNISLSVDKGEIIGIFGVSGAGKTTMMRTLICQIDKKNWVGVLSVVGLNPERDKSKIIRRIGYVPQFEEPNLYYDLSPVYNLKLFGEAYGIRGKKLSETIHRLLELFEIPKDMWNKRIGIMSGGERKRISFAIGMINTPDILLLDEPTTGIDASRRVSILNYLKKLNQQTNITIMLISHDLEAMLICDKCAILKDGRLLEFGTPDDLISSLPGKGVIIRFKIPDLNNDIIKKMRGWEIVKDIIRTGHDLIEVFVEDPENGLPNLIKYVLEDGVKFTSVTKDKCSFQRYFQIRIQKEEEKNARKKQ